MLIHSVLLLVQVVLVKSISSPCVNICTLIDGKCVGCGRSGEEIREWLTATDDRKQEILERIVNAGIQRGLRGV